MPKRLELDLPDMPIELKEQVEAALNGARSAGEEIVVDNMGAFSIWLNCRNPELYRKVSPYLEMIFKAVKKALKAAHSFLFELGRFLSE